MRDPVDREIRLAFWKVHVLHHAAKAPVYGLWMLDELAEHGHRLSPGTLYPLLARMEANGWLRSESDGSGKSRRNYVITPAGRAVLRALRHDIEELHEEVVLDREEPHGNDRHEGRDLTPLKPGKRHRR